MNPERPLPRTKVQKTTLTPEQIANLASHDIFYSYISKKLDNDKGFTWHDHFEKLWRQDIKKQEV